MWVQRLNPLRARFPVIIFSPSRVHNFLSYIVPRENVSSLGTYSRSSAGLSAMKAHSSGQPNNSIDSFDTLEGIPRVVGVEIGRADKVSVLRQKGLVNNGFFPPSVCLQGARTGTWFALCSTTLVVLAK